MQGKRHWAILTALAAGAGILFLAWGLSRSSDAISKKNSDKTSLQWTGDVPAGDPGAGSDQQAEAGAVKDYVLRGKTRRGEPVSISGKTLDPLPQGRYKVVQPLCRVQLSDRRVFQLKSDHGTIDAPQNLPRGGQLSGRVQVSLYESSDDRLPDLSDDSPDLAVRLDLKDARFDLELEQMDSDGPVHVTSPRFEFKGKGLSMVYNGRRSRMERLEIFVGQMLRVATSDSSAMALASGQPTGSGQSESNGSKKEEGKEAGKEGKERGGGGYYRARFMDQVKVDHKDMALEGDVLSAIFSLGTSNPAVRQQVAGDPSTKKNAPASSNAAASSRKTPANHGPLFQPRETDLRVTWTGRLLIEPEDDPSPDLAPSNDVMLTLASRGSSVNIHTLRDETIQAPVVEYLLSRDRVAFRSSPSSSNQAIPSVGASGASGASGAGGAGGVRGIGGVGGGGVVLDAPQLGILRSQALIIDQKNGLGQVVGPGQLKGRDSAANPATLDSASGRLWTTGKGLPAGMNVSWNDQLLLTFFRSAKLNEPSRLTSIRSAHFHGQVKVTHPELDMASDQMFMELDGPVDGRQSLKTMNMAGQVQVRTPGIGRQPPLAIACDRLNLMTQAGPRQQIIPTGLLAQGHVDARSAGQSVRCDELDVALTGGQEQADSDQTHPLAVKRMVARGQVQAAIDQPATKLTGRYLSIDVPNDQMELLGAGPDQPATLSQPQGTLTGPRVLMSQSRQTLEVDGAGTFAFLQVPAEKAGKKAEPVAVHLSWQKQMQFDHRQGQARFRQRVVSGSQSGKESGRLECDDLQMEFIPSASPAANAPSASLDQTRQIKSMLADGQMRFTAQSWADHVNGQLASRVTIKGPQMRFDQTGQTIDVPGPGSMLFETPPLPTAPASPPSSESASAQAAKPSTSVATAAGLTFGNGQGQTLFTWNGQLTFNLQRHDIDLRRQVTMVHRPQGQSQVMQLDSDRLQADLETTSAAAGSSDMPGWLSGRTTGPKLRSATASGQVVLQTGPQQVRSDEMIYSAQDQTMLLRSGGSRQTEVYKEGQLQLSAVGMRWDLKRNYFEVIQPGVVPVPMR